MKKNWLVATYKINEIRRLKSNLLNQNFEFCLPKIKIKKNSYKLKEEVLFPGYVFVNTSLQNYAALKYTIGIKNIIRFGCNVPCISDEEIEAMQMAEQTSKIHPLVSQIQIGQDVMIVKGSLAGNIVKVCCLPSKKRVGVLLSFLGSTRKVSIPENHIIF